MKIPIFQLKMFLLSTVFLCALSNVIFAQPPEEILLTKITYQKFQPKNCKFRTLRTRLRVIKSNDEMGELLAEAICRKIKTEKVDFDNFTLVGLTFFVPGCETENAYQTEVWRDEKKKTFKIKIITQRKNQCRGMDLREIWLLIPKLPADFTTEFEREELPAESNISDKSIANIGNSD